MRVHLIIGFAVVVFGAVTPATLRADCKMAFSSSTPPPQTNLHVASTSGRFVESSPTADGVSALAVSTGSSESDHIVWRPKLGQWFALGGSKSSNASFYTRQWGPPGDIPLVADFNANRRDDFVVLRPDFGLWFVLHSTFEGQIPGPDVMMVRQWGRPGNVPLDSGTYGNGPAGKP